VLSFDCQCLLNSALQMLQDRTLQFAGQVAGQVPLHDIARIGISGEITLQRSNFPTDGPDAAHRHCIQVGWDAAQSLRRPIDSWVSWVHTTNNF